MILFIYFIMHHCRLCSLIHAFKWFIVVLTYSILEYIDKQILTRIYTTVSSTPQIVLTEWRFIRTWTFNCLCLCFASQTLFYCISGVDISAFSLSASYIDIPVGKCMSEPLTQTIRSKHWFIINNCAARFNRLNIYALIVWNNFFVGEAKIHKVTGNIV